MSLIEIEVGHNGRCGRGPASYYVCICQSDSKNGKSQSTFVISSVAMTELGWFAGDRVKVLLDAESNEIHIRLTSADDRNSYRLSGRSIKHEDAIGKPVTSDFKTTNTQIPRVSYTPLQKDDCYIAENGDLVFVYPAPFNLPKQEKKPTPAPGKVNYREAVKNLNRNINVRRGAR